MKNRFQLIAWLLCAVSFGASPASATEVPVTNWSFEDDQNNGQALSPGEYVYAASGWHESSPGGTDNFTENVAGFTYMGSNHQGMTSGSALWQYLFHPYDPANPQDLDSRRRRLEPGVKYSLIVAIGHRPGWTQPNNNTVFKLQLVDGGVAVPGGLVVGGTVTDLVVGSIDASTIPAGTFRNFNITYDAGATVPPGSLIIQLQCAGSDRAHFDNVHLVAVKPRDLSGGYNNPHPQTPSTPQDAVPAWESRPGVQHVIYLDFDGEPVIGPMPEWNMGRPLNVSAAGLSVNEMRRAFEIVKEDFLPFQLNVTTDRSKYDAALPGRRMRCIITTSDRWIYEEDARTNLVFGGIAHGSSFQNAGRTKDPAVPCFVYVADWNSGNQRQSGASLAQDISHEVGHTLGLDHDGAGSTVYFGGHGTSIAVGGITGVLSWTTSLWGPIMGHGQLISQWNDGSYQNANNPQNDVAIIASPANGFGYAPDDNEAVDAANALSISTLNDSFTRDGFIGRTASGAEDEDWWKIQIATDGVLDLKLKPYEPIPSGDERTRMELNLGIPNLNARVDIFRQSGSFLTGASPPHDFSLPTGQQRLRLADALRVRLIQHLTAGTYYLRITGAGFGNPLVNGYTSYGSMGAYSLDGSIFHHPVVTSSATADVTVGVQLQTQLTAAGGPATWSAFGLPPGLQLSASGVLSGVPTTVGTWQPVVIASGTGGSGQQAMVITVTDTGALAAAADSVSPWPDLTWSTGENAGWFSQGGTTFDGTDALQASPISPGGSAWVQTTVTQGGRINFYWKHSAQALLSPVTMSVNGVEQRRLQLNEDWRIESVNVPAGSVPLRWTFNKLAGAVPSGADTAWLDTVFYEPSGKMLEDAVDQPALTFRHDSRGFWQWQDSWVFTTGGDAAQSPDIGDNESSGFSTTLTGPGTLTFRWSADCEPGNDYAAWFVDGAERPNHRSSVTSGVRTNWSQESVTLTSGDHVIRWAFIKNGSVSTGADTVWVDDIVWTPSLQAPVITNPLNITWTVGQLISYPITATNTPTGYNLTGTLPQGLFYLTTDHLIAGFPQRAGTSNVTLFATNAAGTGQQGLTITIESSFTKWARDNNLTGANAALTADPDRDGRSNLLEMALNLNPNLREPAFAAVAVNPSTKRLTATFSRVTAYQDIQYEVQVTDNLSTWTTIASSLNGQPITSSGAFSVTDTGGSVATVTVVDNAAWPTKSKRSMRIKITQL